LHFALSPANAADYPRGFFLEDLHSSPPSPLYNLETPPVGAYDIQYFLHRFHDFTWTGGAAGSFFSAQPAPPSPIGFIEGMANGEEKVIYENPLGPFRFLSFPRRRTTGAASDGPASWPILGVYDWQKQAWTALGQGHSPEWSADSRKLLY